MFVELPLFSSFTPKESTPKTLSKKENSPFKITFFKNINDNKIIFVLKSLYSQFSSAVTFWREWSSVLQCGDVLLPNSHLFLDFPLAAGVILYDLVPAKVAGLSHIV